MPLTDLANPSRFLAFADRVLPWLAAATLLAFAFGVSQLYGAPDDYQQGATVRSCSSTCRRRGSAYSRGC